ncbi:MAG: 4-(cytidine 5'-diphospho)-2-C-methyl-D-erythritol kinase [Methylobacteriaceae bacterium]|nr:4-(cytidine 5'-diphospho)-2-C-methyl-D-erythritol kinase [Methylobacteriaceae bacterium]
MTVLATRAPAKVNLTLHVLGRRPDGYHELESLVAFAGVSDLLTLEPDPSLSLSVEGPNAVAAGPDGDNLVLRAARHLAELRPGLRTGAFRLVKRLPAAAGIGGGSSDAAAALRLLAELNGLDVADPVLHEAARRTGADVPVCLAPRARMMRGIGDRLGPTLGLAPLFAVLVNPRVEVPTASVFRALALAPGDALAGAPHPGISAAEPRLAVAAGRNDLEPPARALAPAIDEALDSLRRSGAGLARMSGSGATVFGLYPDCHAAARGARTIAADRPAWWVKPTLLR